MLVSLDTETTGLDSYHGSKPYLVTTCDEEWNTYYWEWDVDPFTREPQVRLKDLKEIIEVTTAASGLVLQNSLFDFAMLDTLKDDWERCHDKYGVTWEIPWHKVHEIMFSAHMLASCQRKDLTTQALIYLNVNVQPYEDAVKAATNKARSICRSVKFKKVHGEWYISKKDDPKMPSAGEECWKSDMWLLRAMVKHAPDFLPKWGPDLLRGSNDHSEDGGDPVEWLPGDDPATHPWNTICSSYANSDSEVTLPIHLKHKKLITEKGKWAIHLKRLEVLKIVYKMKNVGVSLNEDRLENLVEEYSAKTTELFKKCQRLSDKTELHSLGMTNALRKVVFEDFGLVSSKKSKKSGKPSMDKDVIPVWLEELDPKSKPYHFLSSLKQYRQRSTAIGYMSGYKKYWQPLPEEGWYRLHPSLNAVGTKTLRWSSNNPNEQNISKKEGFNLRYCFGPRPGRAWASLDYENIELRIPAYESGEEVMIEIFEKPTEPPYFGSYHLLNASIIWPDEFWPIANNKGEFKNKYKSTLYQWTKNFGFAVSYGAMLRDDGWGTADKAAKKPGAHATVATHLKKHKQLNDYWVNIANRTGYVETIPDKTVCPQHGYPLQCSRTKWNKISPTVPLNYHIQGTACWVIFKAMLKVEEFLTKFNEGKPESEHWFMVMQIHDEIVFDFPLIKGYQAVLRKIKSIMESCGDDIGIPLKSSCEIHLNNWSEGQELILK